MPKWSRKIIIAKLKDFDANDINLSGSYIRHVDPTFYWTTLLYFSSWDKALNSAGINYKKDLMARLSPEVKKDLKKQIAKFRRQKGK